jgi:ACS family tartrate transporter-like MFS transporter
MGPTESSVLRKVTWRLIPYLLLLYVVAYIDRANISFAALHMNESLGFDASVYGFAAGIFFIGYFLFEVPSNIMLSRFGARFWITRILLSWGIVVVLTGFVQNATQLHILRFCLGLAEAGLFPGVIYYMTSWFPKEHLAKNIALFMSAIPVAFITGGPISGWLIDNVQGLGLEGWRWMFICEGAAAVILAPITYFYLTDSPQKAKWLTAEEKTLLSTLLADNTAQPAPQTKKLSVFKNSWVWFFSVLYFTYITGTLGLMYFLPQIVQKLSGTATSLQIGLISAVPYIAAGIAMNAWARHSDRKKERYFHAAVPLILTIAVYLTMISGALDSIQSMLTGLTIAIVGVFAFNGPFWALPGKFLSAKDSAAGIAIINSCGGLGGFMGPYIMGYFQKQTGSNSVGLMVLSCLLVTTIILLITLRKRESSLEASCGSTI